MPISAIQALPARPAHVLDAGADPDHLRVLDDATEWSAFSRPSANANGCWESQVVIEGMHCAACALTIEQALRAVPGVRAAEVNSASRRARITWADAAVKPSQWMDAVRRAGYRALPAGDIGLREQRRSAQRLALWRWLVAGFCMMQVMMYATPAYFAAPGDMAPDMVQLLRWASWVLTLPVVFFACRPFFENALRDVLQRRVSMDLPVALGMAITFVVSSAATFEPTGPLGHEVYFDSLTMFVFFLLTGRWLEARLRDRTAGALEALMNRLPDSVERRTASGEFERVAVRRVLPGDTLRVLPGEAFPADGTVLEGETRVDEALLTGESQPLARAAGDTVIAGSHNLSSAVLVRAERVGADTRFASIVALMEHASVHKPQLVLLVDRLARPFLLAVLGMAVLAGLIWWPIDPGRALMVAVAVLIVTCPCALSLATPAALLASAGALARRGVLVRQLQGLEALAQVDTVVFDKTGTLTADGMHVTQVRTREGLSAADALAMAVALAEHSLHPASRALVAAALGDAAGRVAAQDSTGWVGRVVTETPGAGLAGEVLPPPGEVCALATVLRLGSAVHCGLRAGAADATASAATGASAVHMADEKGWLASFELSERIRPQAVATVQALHAAGLRVELLSGDNTPAVQRVADAVGIRVARGDCTPQGKLNHLKATQQAGGRIAMVGDGLNDGPVLAGADVSFSFGNAVPLAQSRADFVVMGDRLDRVADTLLQARRTFRVVRQNLAWAALYNAVCIPLAVVGWLPAWLAGLGMALSSLGVVLNAARLSRGLAAAEKG